MLLLPDKEKFIEEMKKEVGDHTDKHHLEIVIREKYNNLKTIKWKRLPYG